MVIHAVCSPYLIGAAHHGVCQTAKTHGVLDLSILPMSSCTAVDTAVTQQPTEPAPTLQARMKKGEKEEGDAERRRRRGSGSGRRDGALCLRGARPAGLSWRCSRRTSRA